MQMLSSAFASAYPLHCDDRGKVKALSDSVEVGLKTWIEDSGIVGEAPGLTEYAEYV
jgi:hypothetical protein